MTSRSLPFAAVLSLLLIGCSFLLDFEPKQQPCDAQGGCLDGFVCNTNGLCEAIVPGPCGICAPNEFCGQASLRCLPDTCAQRACAPGTRCVTQAQGKTSCVAVEANDPGRSCTQDTECASLGTNYVCLRSAIQKPETAALRPGFCVETCTTGGACNTPGASCQPMPMGNNTGQLNLCVTEGLLTSCTTDARCRESGLVCTLFDHLYAGPTTLCDTPLAGGALPGEACSLRLDAGFPLCAAGLCAPKTPQGTNVPHCLTPCETGSCDQGSCQRVPLAVIGPVRHVPLCVPASTRCANCSAGPAACGADAPRCTAVGDTNVCVAECSPDGQGFPRCPEGLTCTTVPQGNRCLTPTGECG